MTDLKRDVQDDGGVKKQPTRENAERDEGESRTAGTNRDFDEHGASDNQGHGHPREQVQKKAGQHPAGAEDRSESTAKKGLRGGHRGQHQ